MEYGAGMDVICGEDGWSVEWGWFQIESWGGCRVSVRWLWGGCGVVEGWLRGESWDNYGK